MFHLRIQGTEAARARLVWRFALGAATLSRGEREVNVPVHPPDQSELRLSVPDAKEGTILSCALTASLLGVGADEPLAVVTRPIHVFPESPFAERQEWLKSLDIRLFDPEQRTRSVFAAAGIPFGTLAGTDALKNPAGGLLVVGEGVSFRDYRALAGLVQEAAAGGRRVLVLAPGGGEFPLPEPRRLILASEDAIRDLDKRLDHAAWPKDGRLRASGMRLIGERGPVKVEVTEGEGWPWIEAVYEGGGRLLICGFAVVGKWESGPTPRFLLARVLEHVTQRAE